MVTKLENFLMVSESSLLKAAEMWARAFYNGAFYVWIIPDSKIRPELLREFFLFRLRLGVLYGEVYVTPDFEGGACWIPSVNVALSDERVIEAGVIEFSSKLHAADPGAMTRLMQYVNITDPLHEKLAPYPHLYLSSIAVDPIHQKQGLGSALLDAMIERVKHENLPLYLETNSQGNIPYYERFGFTVREHLIIPDTDLPLWIMIRGAG